MNKTSSVSIGRHQIGRFRLLLLSLMMLIGLRPFLDEVINSGIWADVLTDIFLVFALMSGLLAVRRQPRQLRFALRPYCKMVDKTVSSPICHFCYNQNLPAGRSGTNLA